MGEDYGTRERIMAVTVNVHRVQVTDAGDQIG